QVGDLDPLHPAELADVGAAAAVQPGDPDADRVVGAEDAAGRLGPRDGEPRPEAGGGERAAQELAAILLRHRSLLKGVVARVGSNRVGLGLVGSGRWWGAARGSVGAAGVGGFGFGSGRFGFGSCRVVSIRGGGPGPWSAWVGSDYERAGERFLEDKPR